MPFRYITTTLILFMILALASGFELHQYREFSPFSVLHALAEGDGDGGAADGGADAGTGGVSDGGTDAGGTGEATDGGVDAGTPDSGVTDGGVDAGTPDGVTDGGIDAGTPDGVTDGGVDAGTPDADTSITDGGVDAGTPDTGTGGDTGGGGDDSGGGDTPTPLVPTCILSANSASVSSGGASTLSWSTTNATALTIDNAIGAVTPAAAGSTSVSPTVTTTYTGTVTGSGGTDTCSTTVTVPPSSTAPTCTLSANPASVSSGSTAALSWSTTDATALTIDNAIGAVTPAAAGSTSVSPTVTTTYTGTVTGPGGTGTCTATVTVNPVGGGSGPSCTLSANPTNVDSGDTSTLSWTTTNGSTFSIDNAIGSVTPVASGSATTPAITANTTFIGTVTNAAGTSDTCSVGVSVNTGGGTNGGGGGGSGGGSRSPNVTLAALPHIGAQPLAYLYLSQIPYTGLDLGPLGTVLYWIALILWALALAYLVLFGAVPLVSRSARNFGSRVSDTLNAREPQVAPRMISEPVPPPTIQESREAPRGYSSYEGFKSFAHNGALSIDDIVKGLARVPAVASAKAGSHPVPVNVEPIYENVEPIQQLPTLPAGGSTARDLAMALVAGDRLAVFTALRENTRMGTSPEQTLSSAVCLIDDVYRSRVDGTECDPGIARMTARLDTTTLERLVSALSTAIDASYSTGITGAKLALTRALAILGA